MLQAPLPAWLVAWDFSAPAAVQSVDGAAALNLSTPGAPLQFALASLAGAEALAPGATASASLHGTVPRDPGSDPGGAPLISRVSVNGVTCIGTDSASASPSASPAAAPAAAPVCGAAWGPAAGFAGGPGGPSASPSAWRGASPAPGAGEPCALSFCCPDVPALAAAALGPGGPSAGGPAGPGQGPELPPAPMALPSAPAQQPGAGAVPVGSAPSGNPEARVGAPAPLEPAMAAGALADGQAQGARAGNAALVVGVAAAGATALALSAACVAALVLRARRSMHPLPGQQPRRSWPTTSAPVQGLGPPPAAPAVPIAWGPSAALEPDQGASQMVAAAAATLHTPKPQHPAPCAPAPATHLQGVSAAPGPRGEAGAGAAEALVPWPLRAAPPAIRVPVSARAGWLPRSDLNPVLNPSPSPLQLQLAGPCAAGVRGAGREPPRTALGMLTDLRALDAGALSRLSTWPLAARAAAPAPQSPDSPWRPGSAPRPSAQVSQVFAYSLCLPSPVHRARNMQCTCYSNGASAKASMF